MSIRQSCPRTTRRSVKKELDPAALQKPQATGRRTPSNKAKPSDYEKLKKAVVKRPRNAAKLLEFDSAPKSQVRRDTSSAAPGPAKRVRLSAIKKDQVPLHTLPAGTGYRSPNVLPAILKRKPATLKRQPPSGNPAIVADHGNMRKRNNILTPPPPPYKWTAQVRGLLKIRSLATKVVQGAALSSRTAWAADAQARAILGHSVFRKLRDSYNENLLDLTDKLVDLLVDNKRVSSLDEAAGLLQVQKKDLRAVNQVLDAIQLVNLASVMQLHNVNRSAIREAIARFRSMLSQEDFNGADPMLSSVASLGGKENAHDVWTVYELLNARPNALEHVSRWL